MSGWAIVGTVVVVIVVAVCIVVRVVMDRLVDFALGPKHTEAPDLGESGARRQEAVKGTPLEAIDGFRYHGLTPQAESTIRANLAVLLEQAHDWHARCPEQQVEIRSADGRFRLEGFITPAEKPTDRWAVLVHGYSGDHHEMDLYSQHYAALGYNILMPDLRAQGGSEGDWVGMGLLDAPDIIAWCRYLVETRGEQVQLVLHGHSMGGAAVLLASGSPDLPSQVRAIVSDCAYSDAWGMFVSCCRTWFHLPPHPLMDLVALRFRHRGGYDLHAADVVAGVRSSHTPTLFIHGSADAFVPQAMERPLYEACGAQLKEMQVVEGAGHIQSVQLDPQAYFRLVVAFLERAGMHQPRA